MILTQNQLFDKNECDCILNTFNDNVVNWNMIDRKYNSQSINFTKSNEWIFDKLKTFFEKETNIKIIKNNDIIHFHKFILGDWFGKHRDKRDNRLYAVGVLLNDNFEGGDFKLYNKNETILNKTAGNTYIFDVNIEHEITQIFSGERYSLLWFLHIENLKFNIKELI
jgi:hypothetical protein